MNWILRIVFETWYCPAHGGWWPESHFGGKCTKA